MDIKIDEIVKQVLSEIDAPSRPVQPKTTFVLEETPALTGREVGKTAVLDSQEDYMIKNYVLPEVGPKEILVCVEGCMISPSDVTEFLKERRAAGSSAQGQEGTGIIVKVGSENLQDAKGNVLKVGDKVIAAKKAGWTTDIDLSSDGDSYYQFTATTLAVNSKSLKDSNYFATSTKITQGEAKYDTVEDLLKLQKDVRMFRGDSAETFLETLISDVTVDVNKTTTSSNNYSNLSTAIATQRTSVSGVDEDEEAMNLIKFQNAYNLASKMISVMSEMYDKLINETGVV